MGIDEEIARAEEQLWQCYLELKDATERLASFPGYDPRQSKRYEEAMITLRKAEAYFAPRLTLETKDPD